jgi:hypothetical protein
MSNRDPYSDSVSCHGQGQELEEWKPLKVTKGNQASQTSSGTDLTIFLQVQGTTCAGYHLTFRRVAPEPKPGHNTTAPPT